MEGKYGYVEVVLEGWLFIDCQQIAAETPWRSSNLSLNPYLHNASLIHRLSRRLSLGWNMSGGAFATP